MKKMVLVAAGAIIFMLSSCGQTEDLEKPQISTAHLNTETNNIVNGSDFEVLEKLTGEYEYLSDYGTGRLIIGKTSNGYDISDYESEFSYRFLANSSNIETMENNRISIKYPEQVLSDDTVIFSYYILEYGTDELGSDGINVYYRKSPVEEADFLYRATKKSGEDTGNDIQDNLTGALTEKNKDFLAAYQKIVEENAVGTVFSLIYLDGDEIPELVMGDRGNDRYSIYTIKDGILFCLVDSLSTVEFDYFEGSGIVATFARWNGGGDEGGYGWQYYQTSVERAITDEDIPLLNYRYDAVYDGEGNYTGKGITEYFHKGQTVEESFYNEILETLEITEGSEVRNCLENVATAEEILDILGI